ncbi:MAG: HAD-IC family P-type ATPase [Candidatus Aegiribacteria sp.]
MPDEGSEPKRSSNWHSLTSEQVIEHLDSTKDGLSDDEAERRLSQYGGNTLESGGGPGILEIAVRQIRSPLIYLLLAAAALSYATGHTVDALVILAVVLLNTFLGVFQEYRAEQALSAIRKMVTSSATVLRGGREVEADTADIVPGDIIVVSAGSRVPADARIIRSSSLSADESSLTGESVPVNKDPEPVDSDTSLGDRSSMLYMSTIVTDGRGFAVVTDTGMDTEMGGIAGDMLSTEREDTPLQRRIGRLANIIGVSGVSLAALMMGIGVLKGYGFGEISLYAVAIAVSAIPEGLPAAISVTLAAGVRRMAGRNAIVRRLPAVETLGSTTVICSDKTGTITRGEMTVRKMFAGCEMYTVEGIGYEPEGDVKPEDGGEWDGGGDLEKFLRIGAYANDSNLVQKDDMWTVRGMPTDGALIVAARKAGVCPDEIRSVDRLDEIPFSSDIKYMAALHPGKGDDPVSFVKGAPDRILEFCSGYLKDGEVHPMSSGKKDDFERVYRDLTSEGLRVLAGAYREMDSHRKEIVHEDVETDLVFAGFWGISDPPREDALESIRAASGAGIKVVMLTGDHADTAMAIARQTGLADDGAEALIGKDLEEMDDDDVARRTLASRVLARVSPSHKMKILKSLKAAGEIVAMTGDGVNDAPALKSADIGVAMGRSGTEVAKEAADMVLTDDNFSTIVKAIEEGRIIFSNLRRVVFFLITTNLGEIIMLSTAILLGLKLPLQAVMIIWINLVTDGVATVPLGLEPGHRNVLNDPPLSPEAGVLDRTLIRRILFLSPLMAAGTLALFSFVLSRESLPYAQTVAFVTLAAFQWFHTLNARSRYRSVFRVGLFSNKWVIVGLASGIVLQVLAVHTPLGHSALGTVPISPLHWAMALAVSSSILLVDELLKLLGVHGSEPGRDTGTSKGSE